MRAVILNPNIVSRHMLNVIIKTYSNTLMQHDNYNLSCYKFIFHRNKALPQI